MHPKSEIGGNDIGSFNQRVAAFVFLISTYSEKYPFLTSTFEFQGQLTDIIQPVLFSQKRMCLPDTAKFYNQNKVGKDNFPTEMEVYSK